MTHTPETAIELVIAILVLWAFINSFRIESLSRKVKELQKRKVDKVP